MCVCVTNVFGCACYKCIFSSYDWFVLQGMLIVMHEHFGDLKVYVNIVTVHRYIYIGNYYAV